MSELVRLLKPGTFFFWGMILIFASHYVSHTASEDSSFLAKAAFPCMLVSWISGMILIIRVRLRGGS